MMKTTKILESGKANLTGKRWVAKLIEADTWGTSAYYPAEVLERDAATAFPIGTRMFENHSTEEEEWQRPVGDVSRLIGKTLTPGEFLADHPEGPGVFAEVEFYDSYTARIKEIGEDIGLSVDGAADYVEGERDGRFGKIVTSIPYIKSVDVVVTAGAGGKLINITESAGPKAGVPINIEGDQSMTAITKEDLQASFAAFGATLTTAIKESLGAVAPVAEPVAEAAPAAPSTDDIVAAIQAAQAAKEAEAEETHKAGSEVDVAQLVAAVVGADLPQEVVPSVVAAVQAGTAVEDAISAQTKIREAYLAQAPAGSVRIVESGRGTENVSVQDEILSILGTK